MYLLKLHFFQFHKPALSLLFEGLCMCYFLLLEHSSLFHLLNPFRSLLKIISSARSQFLDPQH